VSSLEKARAPKCKEIAHVICTKPPLKKKNVRWREVCSFFENTVEKEKKEREKRQKAERN
jgi:hypothetical protein